ncbi:hypothetical protein ISR92_01185 [Patescibacteria group bacterium]|nr:hypothetical protein [Patescibacteria group bacterium]
MNKKIEKFSNDIDGFSKEIDTKIDEIESKLNFGERKFFKGLSVIEDTIQKVEKIFDRPKKKGENNEQK